MTHYNPYAQRKLLRALEKLWAKFEGFINRFTKSDFNPFYHLGTLTIFMLIVLIATGVYLTILYRPGLDVAYQTVEKIDSTWFGSLMRSMHRYASDGMIVLIVLHMLKMLFSDRFSGQRWLAWTSGWIMLAMVWLTGTMGYWLIWDQRAQWMTEYMMEYLGGSSGLTYVATDLASRTFSNFVIIIFLHVFIPLIGFLGIYIHSLRLSRERWWSPRWVSIQAVVGLVILSLLKPAQSAMPADLSQLVQSVPMDAFYLGFLPLIDLWGNLIFWGLAVLVGGSLFLLPWLASGRNPGPAFVTDPKCTGCNVCYAECPFDAIRMNDRNDSSGYHKLAIINNAQCTGCGICVGACPTDAIDLKGGYSGEQVFGAVKGALSQEKQNGSPVTVLFASHRDEALGGLPAELNVSGENAPVAVATIGEEEAARVITAILPSISAVNIEWIKSLHTAGARDVVLLSHPYDDGVYREDAHWILSRLHSRHALVTKEVHWLETTPGNPKTVLNFLNNLHRSEMQAKKSAPVLPPVKERNKLIQSIVSTLIGTLLMFGVFALALPLDISAGMASADGSAIRVALDLKGKISVAAIPEGMTLPEGADAEKIFGGEHYPVSVIVVMDGETILEETYQPSGIGGNGRISALEFLSIPAGSHQIEMRLKDDENDYRVVYSDTLDLSVGQVVVFSYDDKSDMVIVR
ncbi:MAG: 4Fe-4S dicluster domain-containing protein [Chloroflexi bacterium]|nr:4Fe-4S dicluster domain-containing protein [Chloroflexota bacterium]